MIEDLYTFNVVANKQTFLNPEYINTVQSNIPAKITVKCSLICVAHNLKTWKTPQCGGIIQGELSSVH